MISDKAQYRITATWLHDFWIHTFVTAKYWGKGPKEWTPSLIKFKTLPPEVDFMLDGNQRHEFQIGGSSTSYVWPTPTSIEPPSQLCNWSIHYQDPEYESVSSPATGEDMEMEDAFDIEDESSWPPWSEIEPDHNLTTSIVNSLQNRDFTTIQDQDLPLASDAIINPTVKSPNEAIPEAIAFAIMARNLEVLEDLTDNFLCASCMHIKQIHLFHLAATFLDGSRTCCSIMWRLVNCLNEEASIGRNYVDNAGLTVLDALFVSILRSHTTLTPDVLLPAALSGEKQTRFPGATVDVCGRWDADSPCARHLQASGEVNIPPQWKHMFCHTSVQAICHCITAIFTGMWRPDINTPSGLFRRRCPCGLELTLGPLHALVVTAFHLSQSGLPGETLFGMISCLVCLLTVRADPLLAVDVSVDALIGSGRTADCRHQRLNAAELACYVPEYIIQNWTQDVQLGWRTFTAILNHAVKTEPEVQETPWPPPPSVCTHNVHRVENFFHMDLVKCGDEKLGMVWAAIQVELLTYRRLKENEPWISPYFDLHEVLQGLQDSNENALQRLVRSDGGREIANFSKCGLFDECDPSSIGCALREEACNYYFANLEDCERTTFIPARDHSKVCPKEKFSSDQ